jgi:adenylate cyclase
MTNKKKSSFFEFLDFILLLIIAVVFLLLGCTGVFKRLDYSMYDFLLWLRKEPEETDKILLVNIDNESVRTLGDWPWSRDVLADCLIRMKELGASEVVFDVEYLSPSQKGIQPQAEENLDEAFSASKKDISDTIRQFSNTVAGRKVQKSEISGLTRTLISDSVEPIITNLQQNVALKIYRDNDEYFGRAIQFFGNTWLAVNTRDAAAPLSDEDKAYVEKRMMLSDVTDTNNYIAENNKYSSDEQYNGLNSGFSPAIHTLISRAAGAGFTNTITDSDGIHRRIELLYKYDGKYIPQLSFAPLLHMLDTRSIERTERMLIVHGALLPGREKRTDIRIPLDRHGRMLVNRGHKAQKKTFRNESVLFLEQLDSMENNMVNSLKFIQSNRLSDSNGDDFEYVTAARKLVKEYNDISEIKQKFLSKCTGYDDNGRLLDGLTVEEYNRYFSMKEAFYQNIKYFIGADYMRSINVCTPDLIKITGEEQTDNFLSQMQDSFDSIRNEDSAFDLYMTKMKKIYKDSFCIIGNTAVNSTGIDMNPAAGTYQDAVMQADVFNTIIQQNFITPVSWLWGMLIAAAAFFFMLLLWRGKSDIRQNIAGGICVICVIAVLFFFMIVLGWYIPLAVPSLFIITVYIAEIIIRFTSSRKEKGFLRQTFSAYLSKNVVNEIINDPGKLKLDGEDRHITALFTDLQSFSSFSEMVTPSKLVSILNEYLDLLSGTILQYGGTIDKYRGDEIESFFGAPIDISDHAYRACCAGVRMKQAEKLYNEKHLADRDIPQQLETRMGINTGNMVVGNMGTHMKMNYSIIGNDVTVARCLESVNKMYKSWILVSEETWNEANSGQHTGELVSRRFDKIRVAGINKPVQIYNILGFKSEMTSDQLAEIDIFQEAFKRYLLGDFKSAGSIFADANRMNPGDNAALVFAERCKNYTEHGIPEIWDGVINVTAK